MDYEKVLKDIGGFGKFHIILFNILSFTSFKAAFDFQVLVFQLGDVPFRCANTTNYLGNSSLVYDNVCETNRSAIVNGSLRIVTEQCEQFEFDERSKGSSMASTMVSSYSIVCARAWLNSLISMLFWAGCAVGMSFGAIGDKIGRKKVILICGFADVILTPIVAAMPTAGWQMVARFMKGIPAAVYYQGLLLLEEVTEEKHRSMVGNIYWIWWCLGYVFAALMGYLVPHWIKLQLIAVCPCIIYFVIFFICPESPRWLILKGRQKEAHQVFKRIAKVNGKTLPGDYFTEIKVEEEPTGRFLESVKYPEMRKKSLIVWFVLLVFALAYFGLTMDATFASDNVFLNAMYTGFAEIPSSLIAWKTSEIIGRRSPATTMMVFAGICVIIVPFVPKESLAWLRTMVAIVGKTTLTASYCIMDVYATELFPTTIRSSGLFFGAFLSQMAAICAPNVNAVSSHAYFAPYLIYGVLAILAGSLIFLLPETRGCPLAENIEEAEMLRRGKEDEFRTFMKNKIEPFGETELLHDFYHE